MVLRCPSAGEAAYTLRPIVCGIAGVVECTCSGYAVQPVVGAVVLVYALRGEARHGAEVRAAVEHAVVASLDQRRGGQQQGAGVGQSGVSIEKAVEDKLLVRQVGFRGEVLLVEQAHDVAIRLARKVRAVALNLHLGAVAVNLRGGAVAVEAHLVARADGDVRRLGDGGLRSAVHRVLHARRERAVDVHLHRAGGQRLDGERRGQALRLGSHHLQRALVVFGGCEGHAVFGAGVGLAVAARGIETNGLALPADFRWPSKTLSPDYPIKIYIERDVLSKYRDKWEMLLANA